jgi:hypothetical protein
MFRHYSEQSRRPRHLFRQPAPSCRCSRGPLGPCFPVAPGCHPERSEGSAFLRVALHERRIADLSPSRFSNIPTFKHFNAPLPQITGHQSLSPLQSALLQNAPITPLESALPKTQHLKPFRMNTSEKKGRGEGSHLPSQRVSIFEFPFSIFALSLPLPTTHCSPTNISFAPRRVGGRLPTMKRGGLK